MQLKDMDKFTLLRWSALIDGVNMIMDKAEKSNINLELLNFKQNHIVKFIDEKTERVKTF